jgi:hypothetical protein
MFRRITTINEKEKEKSSTNVGKNRKNHSLIDIVKRTQLRKDRGLFSLGSVTEWTKDQF